MNLIRLLVIALVVYLVLQIFKRWAANKSSQSQVNKEKQVDQKQMVRCEICQLHIPKDEALQQDDKFYCSQAHLDGRQD